MRCTVATRHSVSVGATGGGRGESTVILASCCLGIGGASWMWKPLSPCGGSWARFSWSHFGKACFYFSMMCSSFAKESRMQSTPSDSN